MSDLYPTPTRLALLRAVAAGEVRFHPGYAGGEYEMRWGRARVTARIEEMARAGWVRTGRADRPSLLATRPIEITDAGRAVLAAALLRMLDTEGGER